MFINIYMGILGLCFLFGSILFLRALITEFGTGRDGSKGEDGGCLVNAFFLGWCLLGLFAFIKLIKQGDFLG